LQNLFRLTDRKGIWLSCENRAKYLHFATVFPSGLFCRMGVWINRIFDEYLALARKR